MLYNMECNVTHNTMLHVMHCNMSCNVTTRGFDVKAFKVTSTKTSQKVGCKSEGRFQRTNPKFGTQLN